MDQQRERKRRKWDVPGPSNGTAPVPAVGFGAHLKPGQSMDPDAIKRAQEAAAAVLHKITSQGVALGTLPTSKAIGVLENRLEITREVVINDAAPSIRTHLTKRPTQDDIMRRTGTVIVTKGRYYPPGVPVSDHERPLHLKITPGAAAGHDEESRTAAVEAAVSELNRIMQGGTGTGYAAAAANPPRQLYSSPSQLAPQPAHMAQMHQQPLPAAYLYVGIEPSTVPPQFDLLNRIRGPGNAFLQHVATTTSTSVQLRGRGSITAEGPEPLHIHISGANPKSVEDAKSLAQDLLNTVKADLTKAYPHPANAGPPQYAPPPFTMAMQPVPQGMAPYTAPVAYPPPNTYYAPPAPQAAPQAAPQGPAGPQSNAPPPYGYPMQAPAPVYHMPVSGAPGPYPQQAPPPGTPPLAYQPPPQMPAYTGQAMAPYPVPQHGPPAAGAPGPYPPGAYAPPPGQHGVLGHAGVAAAPYSTLPPGSMPMPGMPPYASPYQQTPMPYPHYAAGPYAVPGYYPAPGSAPGPMQVPLGPGPGPGPRPDSNAPGPGPAGPPGPDAGITEPRKDSPPKRKFREFKEGPSPSQADSTDVAASRAGPVYAPQYGMTVSASAESGAMRPPPPRYPPPGAPAPSQPPAALGAVKAIAGIAGLVDYDGDD